MEDDKKTIDQLMAEYRMTLVTAKREGRELPKPPAGTVRPPRPKLTATEKLARTRERLARLRAQLHKDDARRVQRLLSEAKLHWDAGDILAVYGIAAEIMHTAKVHVLGLEQNYPILVSSIPPAPSTGFTQHPAPKSVAPPTLPAQRVVEGARNDEDEDPEGAS